MYSYTYNICINICLSRKVKLDPMACNLRDWAKASVCWECIAYAKASWCWWRDWEVEWCVADKRFARLSWECAEGVLGEVNIGVGGFSDLLLGCGRCMRGICAWFEGVDCDGAEEGGDARPLNGSASRSQRPCLVRVACGVYQTKPVIFPLANNSNNYRR